MELAEYARYVKQLPFGKRLPTALYVFRADGFKSGNPLNSLVAGLASKCEIPASFNVIKFRTDELKLSFLSYPDFLSQAHPALRHAITIDLATGNARRTDYAHNVNPPILHRKECLLPPGHPRRGEFKALTAAEEAAGLYENAATIGFKLNWEKLLQSKGLVVAGHSLTKRDPVRAQNPPAATPESEALIVDRHKTALTRYELSKPVKSLLEYGVLRTGSTFFDYGCGQGSDVRGLQALGYPAEGWDPVFRPEAAKRQADVVNLGYVVNVIEDPAERLEALVDAYRYAKRVLTVSALITQTVETGRAAQFGDGVLTRRNTFQKHFEQHELQQYIEDALETTAVPVGLGVFYVFRVPADQQDFVSARSRRPINWTQVSSRLGLGAPPADRWEALYRQHNELLDAYWKLALHLGRTPAPEEFPKHTELVQAVGSAKKAMSLFVRKGGAEALKQSAEARRNDLLVYLALANLREKVPYGHLSATLRLDVRQFFGNYRGALGKGLELLYAAGDPGEIELACEEFKLGWHDEQALYVHRSLLERLPGVLRAYVGCATSLFGDVAQADIIKMHKASGKVTFLLYDDFANKALPELQHRIKVNLKTRWVQAFDHRESGQLLFFKERFLGPDHPALARMQAFSGKLRKLGIGEPMASGPTKQELAQILDHEGLNENLNKKRGPRPPASRSASTAARGAGQNSSLPPEGGGPQPTGTPPSGGRMGAQRNLSCAPAAKAQDKPFVNPVAMPDP